MKIKKLIYNDLTTHAVLVHWRIRSEEQSTILLLLLSFDYYFGYYTVASVMRAMRVRPEPFAAGRVRHLWKMDHDGLRLDN